MGLPRLAPRLGRQHFRMAQYLNPHQKGIVNRYYQHADSRLADRLGQIVSDLYLEREPSKVAALWKAAHDALKKTPIDQLRVGRIVAERNAEALAKLLGDVALGWEAAAAKAPPSTLPGVAPVPSTPEAPAPASSPVVGATVGSGPVTHDMLKSALAAFKKRLKITRLDDESKLGAKYVTGGRKSSIVAITPPNQFPRLVWDELVKQGKLKYAGGGLYELVGP